MKQEKCNLHVFVCLLVGFGFCFLREEIGVLFFFKKKEKSLLLMEYELALGEGHFNSWAVTSYPSKW